MRDFNDFKQFVNESGKLNEIDQKAEDAAREVSERCFPDNDVSQFIMYQKQYVGQLAFSLLEAYHEWLNQP